MDRSSKIPAGLVLVLVGVMTVWVISNNKISCASDFGACMFGRGAVTAGAQPTQQSAATANAANNIPGAIQSGINAAIQQGMNAINTWIQGIGK